MKTITVTVDLSGSATKRIQVSDELYEELQKRTSNEDDDVHAWNQQYENQALNAFSGEILELAEYPDLGEYSETLFGGLDINFEQEKEQAEMPE